MAAVVEELLNIQRGLVGLVLAMVETIYDCAQLCWMRTGEESADTINAAKRDFWLMLVASVLTQTRRILFLISSLSWIGKNGETSANGIQPHPTN